MFIETSDWCDTAALNQTKNNKGENNANDTNDVSNFHCRRIKNDGCNII